MNKKFYELITKCSKKNIITSVVKEESETPVVYIEKEKRILVRLPNTEDQKIVDKIIQDAIDKITSID